MTDPELLAGLPAHVAAAIAAALPGLREAEAHAGRFDLDELAAFTARAPAVRVALLRVGPGREMSGPSIQREARLAAFVVTRDAPGLPRDRAAAAIAQRLLTLIANNRWSLADLGQAREAEAENLYSKGARGQGVSLWAVSWLQPLALEAAPAAGTPVALYVSQAPEIGAAHEDDYELIGSGAGGAP